MHTYINILYICICVLHLRSRQIACGLVLCASCQVIGLPRCFHGDVPKDGWRSLLQCHGNLEDESVTETELWLFRAWFAPVGVGNGIYIYTCNLKRLRICNPFEKDSFLNEKNTFSYPGTYFEEGTYFGGILIKKFWIHHVLQHSFSFSICFSSTYLQNTIWFLQSSNSSSNIRSLGSCPTHLDSLFHPQAVFVHQRGAYDLSGNTLGTPEVERSRSG